MKKIWIVVLLICAAAAAGIYYFVLNDTAKTDPYTVIPSNSILVVEVTHFQEMEKELKEKKLSGVLKNFAAGKEWSDRLKSLDSLSEKASFLSSYNASMIFSLHKSGSEFDYIFYLPLHALSQQENFGKTWDEVENNQKKTQRDFKGLSIISVPSGKSGNKVHFISYQGLFIASFSESLLEDVINKIQSRNEISFWKKEEVKKSENLGGKLTIYLNYEQLPSLFSAYSDDPLFKKLSSFADESVLDLKLTEGQLFLNGYSYTSGSDYLDIFKGQQPQDFQVKNYLPLTTYSVFYLGFDNPDKLYEDLTLYLRKNDPEIIALRDSISSGDSLRVRDIFKVLRSEIAVCSVKDSSLEKLVFLKTVDSDALLKNLLSLSGKDSSTGNTSMGKLSDKNILMPLFGRLFNVVEQTWFLLLDDYVVLSGSPSALNNLMESLDNENVWGKTLYFSSRLEENLAQLNVGYLMNPAFNPDEDKEPFIPEEIEMVTLQFSNLGGTSLTGFTINYEISNEEVQPDRKEKNNIIVFDSPIQQAIIPENGNGLFVRDSSHLHYINEKGEVEWKILHEGNISSIYNLDLNNDKNPDYVFASGNIIYTLDKNGKALDNYQIRLNDTLSIEHFSVIDYDGNKDYRLIAADRNGHVYFYNKEGKNLEGWTPKVFSGSLIEKVRHLRLKGKDYILAAERQGKVHLLNRRGENMDGFPVNPETELSQGLLVRKGPDPGSTYILAGVSNGDVYFVNLQGKIVRREKYAQSYLLRDEKGSGSMMARKIGSNYEIMDLDGRKQYDIRSNQIFSSISIHKTPTNKEVIALWNNSNYQIFGPEGTLIADGKAAEIHSLKIWVHEKKKEVSVIVISGAQMEIRDFTY